MSLIAFLVSAVALGSAGVLSLARLLRPGTLADRTLGLDMFVVVFAAAITVGAAYGGGAVFLPLVTVVALLAFVATVTVARFLEPPTPRGRTTAEPESHRPTESTKEGDR